jgi:hypothetical protein
VCEPHSGIVVTKELEMSVKKNELEKHRKHDLLQQKAIDFFKYIVAIPLHLWINGKLTIQGR